jgi:type II secretory pathway pseudopilin PulG
MKLPLTPKQRATGRMAFTLVELLVVIAIIIVLASLLLAAVFKALDAANEAATRTDITQLSGAVQAFETKFNVKHIPSRIILCENPADYFNPSTGQPWTQLHQDSLDYLQQVFPQISRPTLAQSQWALNGIDWNGDNAIFDPPMPPPPAPPAVPYVGFMLEGEQCLAFFLGGIPQQSGSGTFIATGFSTNASNPAAKTADRIPPFFDFKSDRLIQWPNTAPGFPSYKDGYGKIPYAYFSSYKSANNYNRYFGIPNPYMPPPNPGPPYPNQSYFSDCQALRFPPPIDPSGNNPPQPMGLWPYAQSWGPTIQYLNPQTFQIISAGKNGQFGLGTYPPGDPNYGLVSRTWAPSNAAAFYPTGDDKGYDLGLFGWDDVANFYDRLLGVPTQ